MYMCIVCKFIYFMYCQIAAAVQDHTTDYDTGDIPSYQLYLNLSDIMKLSMNIPQEYVVLLNV